MERKGISNYENKQAYDHLRPLRRRYHRKQSPYVPLTPEELVADSLAAVRAGACILHIHVRDDEGANTMETSRFVQVVSMIREALRTNHLDAIINVTTSGTKFSRRICGGPPAHPDARDVLL